MNTNMHLKAPVKTICLYTAEDIDQLDWPETAEGLYAKKYFTPLIKNGIQNYVENINASLCILQIKDRVLPLLIVDNEYENSYVCSPYGHYVLLGLESLHLFNNRIIRKSAEASLKGIGRILKQGSINNIIYINHWLFSTDLHAKKIDPDEIKQIVNFLKEKFPKHAIAFRSINGKNNPELKEHLKKNHFSLLFSRHVYLTETSDESIFKTRILKSDLKLFRESDFQILENHELTSQDFARILELYHLLSIEQHSALNPRLNLCFISFLIEENILQVKALKKNGIIEGAVGYVEKDQILFCPFIAYDKKHPDKTKLYRLLSTIPLIEAKKKGFLFHQSAGASFYKTLRRAIGYQEYLAVYTRHLSYKQKIAWGLLQGIMNIAAGSLMKKY
jgi:hypothetical protein